MKHLKNCVLPHKISFVELYSNLINKYLSSYKVNYFLFYYKNMEKGFTISIAFNSISDSSVEKKEYKTSEEFR